MMKKIRIIQNAPNQRKIVLTIWCIENKLDEYTYVHLYILDNRSQSIHNIFKTAFF